MACLLPAGRRSLARLASLSAFIHMRAAPGRGFSLVVCALTGVLASVEHVDGHAHAATRAANTVPFEFCLRCFLLRALDASLTKTVGWVRITADNQLALTNLKSEASHFQRYRAGTWGWPGNVSEAIISTPRENEQQVCFRASLTGGAAAGVNCTDGIPPMACRANAAGERIGQCELYRWHAVALANTFSSNVVRIDACADDGGHCNSWIPLLGSAGDGLSAEPAAFEVICDSSCGFGLNGAIWSPRGNAVIGFLIGVALLPIVLYLIHTEVHRRRPSADDNPWPVRRRPLAVFLVFEGSWMLLLAGLAPSILWLVDDLWLNRADAFLPVVIPAAVGMLMCLRPDDPPVAFRTVSVLIMSGVTAACTMLCMYLHFHQQRSGGDCGGSVLLQDCPWTGHFQWMAIDAFGIAAPVSTAIIGIILVGSQSRILIPSWRYGLKGPQALRWFWKTIRGALLAMSSVQVLMWVVEGILSSSIRDATVLERAYFSVQHDFRFNAILSLLFCFFVTSPRFRLHLHAKFVKLGRATNRATRSYTRFDTVELPNGSKEAATRRTTEIAVSSNHTRSERDDMEAKMVGLATSPYESWHDIDLNEIWMTASEESAATKLTGKAHELPASITSDHVVLGSIIGRGGYSNVYGGTVCGKPVAIKAFKRSSYRGQRELGRLGQEARIALTLSHPNVVNTLGKILLPGPCPALVLELTAGGSLHRLLHERPHDTPPLPEKFAHKLVHEAAMGLAYLHDNSIIHRDVKTSNVLLSADPFASWRDNGTSGCDETVTAKLSDFGIATRFGMEHTSDVGTTRYMAPEVVFGPYTHTADVYSFSLLIWETMHRAIPFSKFASMSVLILAKENARLHCEVPRCVSAELAELIEACWLEDPSSRPSMWHVCSQLENIYTTQFGAARAPQSH